MGRQISVQILVKPRTLLLLPLLALAGCQPSRPPSPAAQKLIKEQTATGPVNTKVRAKPFTYPVRAGELSLWDIKVFNIKDKESGLRQEWKHYAQLPQDPNAQATNTQVLMKGWIISEDGTIFLPQKPAYKAYGSFYTDWTLPRPGPYTLWLEYQPSVAHQEELSLGELMERKASYNLPREVAHWDFVAVGEALEGAPLSADKTPLAISTPVGNPLALYNSKGARVERAVIAKVRQARAKQKVVMSWLAGRPDFQNPEVVAIAPDRSTMLHGIGLAPTMTFSVPGKWKIWFSYTRNGESFAAPYVLKVAP